MVFTLWVITTVTFLIMHIIPGDPFSSDAKIFPEEVIQNMRAKYHLDEPLWNQYVAYLDGVVHFDFGESVQSTGQGVSEIITTGFASISNYWSTSTCYFIVSRNCGRDICCSISWESN